MTCFFYILRCVDNSLYSGTTTDLNRRIEEHNDSKKGAKYTRSRRPVTLVYSEEFSTMSSALKREIEIKKWTKIKKEELICSIKI